MLQHELISFRHVRRGLRHLRTGGDTRSEHLRLIGRYVTDWAGPDALVRGLKTKLGGPNMPGDTLKLRGKVAEAKDGVVAIQVSGNNSWGSHASSTVTVELPRK